MDDLNANADRLALEDAELARMADDLSAHPAAFYGKVPPPGYCHPYHERHKRAIVGWLDGTSGLTGYDLRLPVAERVKFGVIDETAPITISDRRTITVRRQKAWAAAPYVGRPFVYWWWCAVDDFGRGVGAETTEIAYTDGQL